MELIDILRENNAYKLIKTDKDNNMLSHSYMIVGDDSIVVDEFIKLIKLLVYCETGDACMHCMACTRVINGNNTNIYDVVPTVGKDIRVDDIGAMIEDTYIAPYEDTIKVYTINRGESMNPQSQNKLLKTLEEPVGKKLMLIGTTNESNMLDTIKSRCKKVYISPLTLTETKMLLGDESTADEIERAYKLAGGRISRVMDMLHKGDLALEYDRTVRMLKELKNSRELPRVVGMMDKKINPENVRDFLGMLEVIMRDTLKGSNEDLVACGFNVRAIANIQDLINKARERLYFNASAPAVLDYVLFGILEVKYKCR